MAARTLLRSDEIGLATLFADAALRTFGIRACKIECHSGSQEGQRAYHGEPRRSRSGRNEWELIHCEATGLEPARARVCRRFYHIIQEAALITANKWLSSIRCASDDTHTDLVARLQRSVTGIGGTFFH